MVRDQLIRKMYGRSFEDSEETDKGDRIFGWHLESPNGKILPIEELDDDVITLLYGATLEVGDGK